MNRIAFPIVALIGLGAVIGLSVSSGLAEPTAVIRVPNAEQLTALRRERRDALREAAKQTAEAYRQGVVDYASISRINIELLNAELDLAPDRAGRVAVRERIVEQFKGIEKSIAQRVENAQARGTEQLEAKAARAKAEIDLLLEPADGK